MRALNCSSFMSFGLVNEKLFVFYYLKNFANYFFCIDFKDMGILWLDASCYDESNEPFFIKIRLLVAEILWFKVCQKIKNLKFFFNFYTYKFRAVSTTNNQILMI